MKGRDSASADSGETDSDEVDRAEAGIDEADSDKAGIDEAGMYEADSERCGDICAPFAGIIQCRFSGRQWWHSPDWPLSPTHSSSPVWVFGGHHSKMTPAVRLLEQRKIAHRIVSYDHDPTAGSYGGEAADALGVDPAHVFKTLLAEIDERMVVALVPVTGNLDLKALARAARGKKAVMADPKAAERITGYVVGGISPLGQRKRLPTYIDSSCQDFDEIYISAGKRGLEIVLAPTDLISLLDAHTDTIGTPT